MIDPMKTNHSGVSQTTLTTLATLTFASTLAALFLAAAYVQACGSYHTEVDLKKLAELAVSENSVEASGAIAALRAKGATGLAAFLALHSEEIHRQAAAIPGLSLARTNEPTDPRWERLSRALDTIGGQRDCFASRLYWHTDLEKAKAAAAASGKPILSLRLLGRLDEELSCANSRFFRTALYANAEVSRRLREHVVLHWQSVRPVPKITIDFGDGRKLERTLTGNSIHYVLHADGRPIDALPGLYGPKAFLRGLMRAEAAAKNFAVLPVAERDGFLRAYHQERLAAIQAEWNDDLTKVGRLPVLEAMGPAKTGELEAKMDEATWAKIAALHSEDARLDQGSRTLMARKNPDAFAAGKLALSKRVVEDPLVRAARQFERSMAEDTVRNEYLFHTRIHEWLGQAVPQARDAAVLNEKVYAELFLTPSTDPWLGLKPSDAYSALDHDGVVTAAKR